MFVKILSVCLLLAAGLQDISPIFSAFKESATIVETEEESKGKEIEFEKEKGSKEKFSKDQLICQAIEDTRSLHTLENIYFKYCAYLSLPEIPPDQA